MRIDQIVPAIDDPATGPAYSVPALCSALAGLGETVVLHALGPAPPLAGPYRAFSYPRLRFPYKLGFSPAMKRGLRSAAAESSVIHTHGLWMMPNLYPAQAAGRQHVPLVWSPRGMMDAWAWEHHRWRKRLVWLAGQGRALRSAACFHATAESEAARVRDLGFRAPVAVVPNGVTVPELNGGPHPSPAGRRTLLFLARVHRKKGVDILLRAWTNVQARFRDWDLVIAGPDDGGYLPKMRLLAEELGARRVTFAGRIPGNLKSYYLQSAELYVLPTHAENWGVSIAEALAHGLPAIVGRGAPWSGIETHGCGWWIESRTAALTETLRQALALPPEDLRALGARGRTWVAEAFSWERVAGTMRDVYLWLLDRGPRPLCVHT